MVVGGATQLSAVAVDTRGIMLSNSSFTWQSSDEAIATVSDGRVTAKAPGSVTISATTAGKKGGMLVTVTEAGECPDGAGWQGEC
jgi:uncharacterized protein YjdB